jgi:hypothetical protein
VKDYALPPYSSACSRYRYKPPRGAFRCATEHVDVAVSWDLGDFSFPQPRRCTELYMQPRTHCRPLEFAARRVILRTNSGTRYRSWRTHENRIGRERFSRSSLSRMESRMPGAESGTFKYGKHILQRLCKPKVNPNSRRSAH